jgi:hypothetical protein
MRNIEKPILLAFLVLTVYQGSTFVESLKQETPDLTSLFLFTIFQGQVIFLACNRLD